MLIHQPKKTQHHQLNNAILSWRKSQPNPHHLVGGFNPSEKN